LALRTAESVISRPAVPLTTTPGWMPVAWLIAAFCSFETPPLLALKVSVPLTAKFGAPVSVTPPTLKVASS
jgi:hypothetical protein